MPTSSEFVASILALSSDRFTPAIDATSLMSSSSLQNRRQDDPPLSNGCSAAHAQAVPEQGSERRDRGRVAGSTARVPRACVLPAAFHTVLSPA